MKVALNRPGKFCRSKQSCSNVPSKYADPRRFFARLASEIFLTSLQKAFFNKLRGIEVTIPKIRLLHAHLLSGWVVSAREGEGRLR